MDIKGQKNRIPLGVGVVTCCVIQYPWMWGVGGREVDHTWRQQHRLWKIPRQKLFIVKGFWGFIGLGELS